MTLEKIPILRCFRCTTTNGGYAVSTPVPTIPAPIRIRPEPRMSRTLPTLIAALTLAAASAATFADVTGSSGGFSQVDNYQPSLAMPMFIQHEGINGFGVAVRIFAFSPAQVSIIQAPAGNWMPVDGRALPSASYGSLFQQIGTTYGSAGAGTFRLPDLRGLVTMGEGTGDYPSAQNYTRAQLAGTAAYTLNASNLPAHNHQVGEGTHFTDSTGLQSPTAFDTMQPSTVMNFTIQTSNGIFPTRGDGSPNGFIVGPGQPFLAQVQMLAATPIAGYGATPCDGRVLNISPNTAVFALCGTNYGGNGTTTFGLPDLRGRLPMGAFSFADVGLKQGQRLVTLATANLPPHSHSAAGYTPPQTGVRGGGQAYTNLQPSLSMTYCIALTGVYPSSHMDDQNGYIGEIMLFAGNFAPAGYIPCDGRELVIADNDVLFALIGTTYGASSPGTFRIPDLRGRTPVAPSIALPIGTAFGTSETSLTVAQMPLHTHTYTNCPADLGTQGGIAGHDGVYDNNDFIAFIELFFSHNAQADTGIQGGLPGHDSMWDNNDFVVFIDRFFAGCN
jgi:microcystin-dependent protein